METAASSVFCSAAYRSSSLATPSAPWRSSERHGALDLGSLLRAAHLGGRSWIQFFCRDGAGRTFGVILLEGRVDVPGLGSLALGVVEVGKLELRKSGGDGRRRLLCQFLVHVDCLGIASAVVIKLGEREPGQRGEIAVPSAGDLD